MKVLLDFIPNHSSKNHKWFNESSLQTPDYDDYYIWKNCDPGNFPDNSVYRSFWLWCLSSIYNVSYSQVNIFNSSAWTYEPNRKQCYYHAYGPNQPDLNLRNAKVQEELDKIVRFWLDQGVAGFRLLSVPFLYEENNEIMNLPENYEYVGHIRTILKEYEGQDGKER